MFNFYTVATPEEKFICPDDDNPPPSRPHPKNPSSKNKQVLPRFKPINKKPPCAGDLTYCDSIDDYPG